MTPQEAKEFIDKWLPCREGGKSQAAKLIKFYHEEAEVFIPSHPQGLKGHQELLPFFELALETCSSWKFQMEELTVTEDGFVFLYKVDIPFKNKVFEKFSGADIVKI